MVSWGGIARRDRDRRAEADRRAYEASLVPARWRGRGWDRTGRDCRREWSAAELTTAAGLADEGRAMGHCAGTYVTRCARGDAAEFSVRLDGARRVTAEVLPRPGETTGALAQVRGPRNRPPTPAEAAAVDRWFRATVRRPRSVRRHG